MKYTNDLLNREIEKLMNEISEIDENINHAENHINELKQAKKRIKLTIDDLEEAKIVLNSSN